jgi:hypothetical protein
LPHEVKLHDEPLVVSEPEPGPLPAAAKMLANHLKRLRIQLEQAELQKEAADSALDFERAARWIELTNAIKRLISTYETFQEQF